MRLPLLAAALAAVAASAAPANAALYPVCATALAATSAGTAKSCTTGNTPNLTYRATRTFTVNVHAGTVEARLTCFDGVTGSSTVSDYGVAPARFSVRLVERVPSTCVATLVALGDVAAATGTSTFAPILVDPKATP